MFDDITHDPIDEAKPMFSNCEMVSL